MIHAMPMQVRLTLFFRFPYAALMSPTDVTPLLGPTDPEPVEVLRQNSASELMLLCEHAGRAVPQSLGDLGVCRDVLNSHRGWDIGAEDVARRLSSALCAPLVLQRYSRLVIDCNRPPGSPASVPATSDCLDIPRNRNPTNTDLEARTREIFEPMNRTIAELFHSQSRSATFSVHSFTPRVDDFDRPWHAGFLTRASKETAKALMASIRRKDPSLSLALNEPYQIEDNADWFIPRFAERLGLPHCLIEIRNDQISEPEGAARWAELLAFAISEFMEGLA